MFSQRYGYKPLRDALQVEGIDEPLRNGLWSLLKVHCFDHVRDSHGMYRGPFLSDDSNRYLNALCRAIWFTYFRRPLDSLSDDWSEVYSQLREHFFNCAWYEAYDFIEFVADNYKRERFKELFEASCNALLEREMSGYRFVNGVVTRITAEQEIAAIENAIGGAPGPVQEHLARSLELLSNRKTPDYRNSIKEAISAVESLVKAISKNEKGTLGDLLKKLDLHPALRAAFSNLYGYTSDTGGIRHALLETDKVDFSEAKFMLVVCSAFINFVAGKSTK